MLHTIYNLQNYWLRIGSRTTESRTTCQATWTQPNSQASSPHRWPRAGSAYRVINAIINELAARRQDYTNLLVLSIETSLKRLLPYLPYSTCLQGSQTRHLVTQKDRHQSITVPAWRYSLSNPPISFIWVEYISLRVGVSRVAGGWLSEQQCQVGKKLDWFRRERLISMWFGWLIRRPGGLSGYSFYTHFDVVSLMLVVDGLGTWPQSDFQPSAARVCHDKSRPRRIT